MLANTVWKLPSYNKANLSAIAYTSRALTETERRYAQIEKEMLAIVFSLEKFHRHTYGRLVQVFSDHKPLEKIFKKPLAAIPRRLQGMRMRLQAYDIEVIYTSPTCCRDHTFPLNQTRIPKNLSTSIWLGSYPFPTRD